jgi:hypothetical protein
MVAQRSLDVMLSKFPLLKSRSYVELWACGLSLLSNPLTHSDQLQRQLL